MQAVCGSDALKVLQHITEENTVCCRLVSMITLTTDLGASMASDVATLHNLNCRLTRIEELLIKVIVMLDRPEQALSRPASKS